VEVCFIGSKNLYRKRTSSEPGPFLVTWSMGIFSLCSYSFCNPMTAESSRATAPFALDTGNRKQDLQDFSGDQSTIVFHNLIIARGVYQSISRKYKRPRSIQ
jgi:hypothetical protein